MIKEHRIPTIIGSILLITGLIAGLFLVQRGPYFFLKAAPEITPSEVKITNVTDSSFTVSWVTTKETNAFVKFGEDSSSLGQSVQDDRDSASGQTGNFLSHHVTVKNLRAKTKYYFKLGSGGRIFDNSSRPYEITTGATPTGSPPSDLASGTVITRDGQKAEGAIVYISIANMTPQSVLVGNDGRWLIPLSTAFSGNLSGYAQYDHSAQVEEIFVQAGTGNTATAVTTTENDNPIPEITLGKTYDFRRGTNDSQGSNLPTPTAGDNASSPADASGSSKFSFAPIDQPTLSTDSSKLAITNPGKEGEDLNTDKPEFTGTGPAGKTIQILVESPKYNGTAVVAGDGTWSWTVPQDLEPGEHKITITYLGKRVTKSFTVLAAEDSNLPAFTATPSATLTPTRSQSPTPTPTRRVTQTPTPTPTRTLTTTPTVAATPTGATGSAQLTPTRIPTATPTVVRTSLPSTESAMPVSGGLMPTFIFLIFGLMFAISGYILKSKITP